MTSDSDPTEVARRANEMFSSVPFEDLREAVVLADSYKAAAARLEELGVNLGDLIDPQVEVVVGEFAGGQALAGGGGRGLETWLAFWREWLEPWEELDFQPSGYETAGANGEHVLVDATVSARGRIGGVPAELSVCQLWTIRDGRVTRYGVHPSRERALAALGSEPGNA